MLSDQELEIKINQLRTYLKELKEVENQCDETMNTCPFDKKEWSDIEKIVDEKYSDYFKYIHDHFDQSILSMVEKRIGYDRFTTEEYIDTLYNLYKERSYTIDEYKGYKLIRGRDCWGNISYCPYLGYQQYSDCFDAFDDDSAIQSFRYAIDQDPESPNFM